MKKLVAPALVIASLWSGWALSQSEMPESDTEISKQVENPVTRRITLPFRYQADFLDGPYKATKDTFSIDQAVVPFRLTEDLALVTRTKLPGEAQPPKKLGDHWAGGLSNGYTTFFLSPEHGEGFYWGVGPVLYYPTATNSAVGVNKWGSGPSAAFINENESPWVFGAVANNIWSFGGPPGSSDRTNQLLLNPFGIAGMASVQHAACAQEVSTPGGYQFFVTPYLWLASVHATTLTPLAREPQVNSNVSTIDLLSHLDGAPFMGSFEARYGALGFLADAIHLPVSTRITTHDIFFQGGNAALKADTGTGIALYRVLEDPVQFADAGLGFRAWGFSSRVALNPGLLPGVSVNPGGGWADPLIGGRYHRELGNGFGLTAYGDVGGFGVGAHSDWQVLGTIDYTLNPSWNLHLGYRSLNFNITGSEGRFGFDVHMRGPILAGTFRF